MGFGLRLIIYLTGTSSKAYGVYLPHHGQEPDSTWTVSRYQPEGPSSNTRFSRRKGCGGLPFNAVHRFRKSTPQKLLLLHC
jgi:hypothetical protein